MYIAILMLKLGNSKTILWIVKLAPKLRIESILLAVFDQELPATADCPHPRAAAEPDPWFLCSNLPSLLRASLSLLFFVPPSPCRDIDSVPASVWPGHQWTSAPWSPVDQCPMVSSGAVPHGLRGCVTPSSNTAIMNVIHSVLFEARRTEMITFLWTILDNFDPGTQPPRGDF